MPRTFNTSAGLACIVSTEVNHNTDHWNCIRELTEDLAAIKRLNRSSTVSWGQQLKTLEVTNSVLKKNISTQRQVAAWFISPFIKI